jgi:hypothetical protein
VSLRDGKCQNPDSIIKEMAYHRNFDIYAHVTHVAFTRAGFASA